MAGVSSCMKYSMFVFNFLFWVCGCIILAVSIWLRVDKEIQPGNNLFSSVNILIAVGSIIMVLGFLGCCGAIQESKCMLILFFVGLLMILLLQIVAGILGAVHKSQAEEMFDDLLRKQVALLTSSQEKQFPENFHKFEMKNKCCGLIDGKEDWGSNRSTYSGCQCAQADMGSTWCPNGIYTRSCKEVIIELFKNNMVIVMGIAFALAFVEILGLVFSMSLYCQIQRK
uniref:Tetraspanin n=1 Tax=Salvator merianae TaxID=96440 RepID=A0A8D0DUX4_SALMN